MTVKTVEATLHDVDPATAEKWLGKNQINRNLRDRVVSAYARDMTAGRWRLSGEAVKFAKDGKLLDGQHRLHAVVRSGVTVRLLVVRGLDDDVQDVIDSGASRSAGDALKLHGEANYSSLAAAARIAIDYVSGQLDRKLVRITHSEVIGFVEANPELRAAVDTASSLRNQIDVPISVLSLAIWRLNQIDQEDCELFMGQLAEKTYLRKGDAVLALMNRLSEVRRSGRRIDRSGYLSLIFRAWNYWRARKSVQTLPIATRGGDVDIPEPK